MELEVAPLDLVTLVRLHALGAEFHGVIARLLKGASQEEILRERARVLRIVAALMGGDMATLARRVWERLRELRRTWRWATIDLETVDGALLALLLLSRGKVPHRTTLLRALEAPPLPSAFVSNAALEENVSTGE